MKRLVIFFAFALSILAPRAFALEAMSLYDNFSSGGLDPALWPDHERIRYVKNGLLWIGQREWGARDSDSGITFTGWSENLPTTATEVRATVRVNGMEVNSCPANPTNSGQASARLVAAYFNVGTATPGSEVGDVIAQIRIARNSFTTDPAGVLQVSGIVVQCTTPDCTGSTLIGNSVPLGTVSIGQAATLMMRWSQASKTFYFNRDGNTYKGTVGYAVPDANPAGKPFVQLSTRMGMPSCTSIPVTQEVDAYFDNVYVNTSAVPSK